jgi:hypothetical protein
MNEKQIAPVRNSGGNAKNVILIVCHKRSELLEKCLESVRSASTSESYTKVVVWQKGSIKVKQVLDKYDDLIDILIQVDGSSRGVTENISRNRFIGYLNCFEFLQADFVVALEDDVMIGFDSLVFVKEVYENNKNNRHFRGVNLGSCEPLDSDNKFNYSRQRFGIHGPAAALTRQSWSHFDLNDLLERSKKELFDGILEAYLRTGFMITPTNSRFIDLGVAGSHTSSDVNDKYFAGLRKSFIGTESFELRPYHRETISHSMGENAVPFRLQQNLLYLILYRVGLYTDNKIINKFHRMLYRLFILKRFTRPAG